MNLESNYISTGETVVEFSETHHGQRIQVAPSLIFSGHVHQLTGDRIAVAAALLVASKMNGSLKMTRPVSLGMAQELAAFQNDPGFSVDAEASLGHARAGGNTLVITDEPALQRPVQSNREGRRLWFTQLRLDRSVGRLFTFDSVVACSNAELIAETRLGSLLALPVLMANELGVSTIEVPSGTSEHVGVDRFRRAVRLLAASQLQLTEGQVTAA